MKLKEKIYNNQGKLTTIVALATAIAIEETFIGFGREIVFYVVEHYNEFCDQYFNPENYFN